MAEEKPEVKNEISTISRREFLKDAGLVMGGATIGSMAFMGACKGEDTTSSVTNTITKTVTVTSVSETGSTNTNLLNLTVNGQAHQILIEPNWTLRDALREQLQMLSVKDMCNGYGACGSCTVIMGGRPVLTCMALAVECEGAVIETAENLGVTKHPLVEAYAKNFCAQCGYCTPGFVITAKALLDRSSSPSEADIREAMGGNLCRCGTYQQHILAVQEAAASIKGGK